MFTSTSTSTKVHFSNLRGMLFKGATLPGLDLGPLDPGTLHKGAFVPLRLERNSVMRKFKHFYSVYSIFVFIHTSAVESMCYFMSDNHADPTIIKISEKRKFWKNITHPASVRRYFITNSHSGPGQPQVEQRPLITSTPHASASVLS